MSIELRQAMTLARVRAWARCLNFLLRPVRHERGENSPIRSSRLEPLTQERGALLRTFALVCPRGAMLRVPVLVATGLAALVSLTGCQSPSQYISPRIEGRVLDAETLESLPDVQIQHAKDVPDPRPLDPPKGATALKSPHAARSGPDGTFVVASQRDLDFLPHARWYSITLSFEHPRYLRRTETYTLAQSTNTPTGEPLVEAGDVLLDRIP